MENGRANHRIPLSRGLAGALFLVCVYFVFDPMETMIHAPIAQALGLHMVTNAEMGLLPYGVLMLVRLALDLFVVAGVLAILRRSRTGFPLRRTDLPRLTCSGLAIGLLVMIGAILTIAVSGDATIGRAPHTVASASTFGIGWLAFDFVGAAGEELYGRVAVLLVAQTLLGWRGAILVSGLTFSVLHLGNPGASWIWLVRLFVQGALLAYAVYRTGSVWWSIGYHTGWNWASAPLFGAAGSGYLNQGHLFTFTPSGSPLITGGSIGPEGSVFAFVAVAVAFVLLLATTSTQRFRKNLACSSTEVTSNRDRQRSA